MPNQDAHQSTSVRDVLRLQTNETHQKLHDHRSFVALFDQSLSLDAYRDLIRAFYGFYRPLDAAIPRVMAQMAPAPYHYSRRAHLLARDLEDLGMGCQAVAATPLCDALNDLITPLTLGGVLYVIEGSTLGAAPIDRAAEKLLDPKGLTGRHFWSWCRGQNGERWKRTTDYLTHLHASGVPLHALEQGAEQTFQLLAQWLAPLDSPARHPMPA